MPWHVAETHPYGGEKAEEHLSIQGYVPFNPKIKVQKARRDGRLVEHTRPYIQGYIFAFCSDEDDWRPINYTRGVKRIMYADAPGQVPAIVRVDVIEALQLLCSDNGYIKEVEADAALLRVGQTVRVTAGSFEGFRGPITWTKGDRLRVLFSMLGHRREIELRRNLVEITNV